MNNDNRKVWFVTGASKGLGFEITKAALSAGDYVAATIRNEKGSIAKKLDRHPRLMELKMDVTNQRQVKITVNKVLKRYGKLDILVNNAGYSILAAIEEASDEEVRAQYDINVFGILNVLRAVLPHLRHQRSGHIINMSSHFTFNVIPGWGIYASSKLAVEGISAGLYKELAPFGIKVTVVEPGLFTADLTAKGYCKISDNPIDAYKETMVGYIKEQTDKENGAERGDPSRLADIIIALSRTEITPLHLPVGADAIVQYEASLRSLAKDVDQARIIALKISLNKQNEEA